MTLTYSKMFPLGEKAPDFSLLDTTKQTNFRLKDETVHVGTVIMFICNHCPFVKHVLDELVGLSNEYKSKNINFIAINSNDVETYPEDSPEKMTSLAQEKKFPFAYLFDEDQSIAKAYDAACTPDFYLFDEDLALVYRGRLDDSTPGNNQPVTGNDLRHALDCLLEGRENSEEQRPSQGCNIKWK